VFISCERGCGPGACLCCCESAVPSSPTAWLTCDLIRAGGNGGKYSGDLGLSESALNSVAEGMEDGLDADSVDPTTGLASGQLALVPSKFSQQIAKREMRHVASGAMAEGGTLTGLVGADAAFSDAFAGAGSAAGVPTTSLHAGVQKRTVQELEHELKERQAMMARLGAGAKKASPRATKPRPKVARAKHGARKAAAANRVHLKVALPAKLPAHTSALSTQKRTVALLKKQL
jgi:hypothetical protein